MSQILLAFGGTILFVLGALHGILTLRDLWTPRSFTPTDDAVRLAMQGAQLAFNPRANLWRAWLGFNLSHSLSLVLFGGGLVLLAWLHFSAFAASHLLRGLAVGVAALYLVLALRFWFWAPALGAGLSLLCILGAVVSA